MPKLKSLEGTLSVVERAKHGCQKDLCITSNSVPYKLYGLEKSFHIYGIQISCYKLSIMKGYYKSCKKYMWGLYLAHGRYVMNMNYYSVVVVIRVEDDAEDPKLSW